MVTTASHAERLEAIQRDWLAAQRRRRELSNRRIRAVNDARDAGLSYGAIAKAMKIERYAVAKILACGYPEDDLAP